MITNEKIAEFLDFHAEIGKKAQEIANYKSKFAGMLPEYGYPDYDTTYEKLKQYYRAYSEFDWEEITIDGDGVYYEWEDWYKGSMMDDFKPHVSWGFLVMDESEWKKELDNEFEKRKNEAEKEAAEKKLVAEKREQENDLKMLEELKAKYEKD